MGKERFPGYGTGLRMKKKALAVWVAVGEISGGLYEIYQAVKKLNQSWN